MQWLCVLAGLGFDGKPCSQAFCLPVNLCLGSYYPVVQLISGSPVVCLSLLEALFLVYFLLHDCFSVTFLSAFVSFQCRLAIIIFLSVLRSCSLLSWRFVQLALSMVGD
jgi:hypothetical protein